MDGGHGNGDDTLYLNHHTAVTRAFHFQEDTFLTLKITTGDAHLRTLGKVQFFGLEVKEMVVVSTSHGDETLHLDVGDDNLLTAAGVGDILQVSDLGLDKLQIGRTGVDKYQVVDDRDKDTHLLTFLKGYLILHGDKTVQMLLFEQAYGVGFTTVGGTHSMPDFGLFIRFHLYDFVWPGSEKGVLPGL